MSLLGIAVVFIIVPYGTMAVAQGTVAPTIDESDVETLQLVLQILSEEGDTNGTSVGDVVPTQSDGPVYPVPGLGGPSGPDSDHDGVVDSNDPCPNEVNHQECLSEYIALSTIGWAADTVRDLISKADNLFARMEIVAEMDLPIVRPSFVQSEVREWKRRWNEEVQPLLDSLDDMLETALDQQSILNDIRQCRDLDNWNTTLGTIAWTLSGLGAISLIAGIVFPITAPVTFSVSAALIIAGIAVAALDGDVDRAYVDLCSKDS